MCSQPWTMQRLHRDKHVRVCTHCAKQCVTQPTVQNVRGDKRRKGLYTLLKAIFRTVKRCAVNHAETSYIRACTHCSKRFSYSKAICTVDNGNTTQWCAYIFIRNSRSLTPCSLGKNACTSNDCESEWNFICFCICIHLQRILHLMY